MNERDYKRAYSIAMKLHKGQVDKAGKPYIGHLERVSGRMENVFGKIAGLLHDSVEDTEYTLDDVEREFGKEMREVIRCLTHLDGEDYFEYVKRASENETARLVKISDLIDNSNLSRLPSVSVKDIKRQEKYNKALAMLIK